MIGGDRFVNELSPDLQVMHVEQRYARGFSDIDMWNFDSFLADVIVAGCEWMIRNGNGVPTVLDDGSQWQEILEEIKQGFTRGGGDDPFADPPEMAWKLLRTYFSYMWD